MSLVLDTHTDAVWDAQDTELDKPTSMIIDICNFNVVCMHCLYHIASLVTILGPLSLL